MEDEVEIKLSVPEDQVGKLAKAKELRRLRKGRAKRLHLVSTYFDTPHHVLRKSGIALRVRDDGKERIQTVKMPAAGPPGLQNYKEWSAPVNGSGPILESIDHPDIREVIRRKRLTDRVAPVFTTDVERTVIRLKERGLEFEMALDRGVIWTEKNGRRKQRTISEAEFELIKGDPAKMIDVVLELCEEYDIMPAHRTKADRGYALARKSLRPLPTKASEVLLDERMTVGEAFQLIIRSGLQQLFDNREPVLDGHPDAVHQSRVAMRRLRAAMRAFKTMLPYHERKAFNGELRWFQLRLSPSRDWHVFLDETVPLIAGFKPEAGEQIAKLIRLARDERRRSTAEAMEHLTSRRYARLVLQFEKWMAAIESQIPEAEFKQPVKPFATAVLSKAGRDLLQEQRALSRLPAEDLHTLRKYGKKARYATEFFSSLWTGDHVTNYLKLMTRIQDRLGEVNDAVVARHILWTVTPARQDAELVELVQDWSQDRVRDAIKKATPYWRKFRKAQPFWESGTGD